MSYRPKSQINVSSTSNNEFVYVSDKQPYNGKYIETAEGRFYAGDDPLKLNGFNEIMKKEEPKVPGPSSKKTFKGRKTFGSNKSFKALKILSPWSYNELKNVKPVIQLKTIPTKQDYKNKFFYRYFAQRINDRRVYKEINFDTYNKIRNQSPEYDFKLWIVDRIKWSLVEGNWPINVLQLRNKQKTGFPGLWVVFPNFSEFAEVTTHNISNRTYPDGEEIPPSLPPAYALRITQQKCSNCILFKEGLCSKWNAEVRNNYWCKSWQPKTTPNLFENLENSPLSYEEWLINQTASPPSFNSEEGKDGGAQNGGNGTSSGVDDDLWDTSNGNGGYS